MLITIFFCRLKGHATEDYRSLGIEQPGKHTAGLIKGVVAEVSTIKLPLSIGKNR